VSSCSLVVRPTSDARQLPGVKMEKLAIDSISYMKLILKVYIKRKVYIKSRNTRYNSAGFASHNSQYRFITDIRSMQYDVLIRRYEENCLIC
jgi:hypothetical protein